MKRITIKHHDKNKASNGLTEFSITLYTDTNTIIDGVEFTPLTYEVYEDILKYEINIDKFSDCTFLSSGAIQAVIDRQALMENWLWINHRECYRVFMKKHSAFMDTLEELQ
jgi:hypothetical protein